MNSPDDATEHIGQEGTQYWGQLNNRLTIKTPEVVICCDNIEGSREGRGNSARDTGGSKRQ